MEYRRSPATARLVLVAAVAFTALLNTGAIGAQAEDLVRRALDDGSLALLSILLALGLYELVLAGLRRVVVPRGDAPEGTRLMVYGGVLVAVGIAILRGGGLSGPLSLGLLVFAIGFVSMRRGAPADARRESQRKWLYALSALLPPAGLAVLLGRLVAGEAATGGAWEPLLGAEAVLLVIAVGAAWWSLTDQSNLGHGPAAASAQQGKIGERVSAHAARGRARARSLAWRWVAVPVAWVAVPVAWVTVPVAWLVDRVSAYAARGRARASSLGWGWVVVFVAGLVVPAAVGVESWIRGQESSITGWLGSLPAMLLLLAAFAAAGALIRLLAADWAAPSAFKRGRTPVVALLLAWVVLATVITAPLERDSASQHNARIVPLVAAPDPPNCSGDLAFLRDVWPPNPDPAFGAESVSGAFCHWVTINAVDDGKGPVPLILVTASGGGVRAAMWTARVLDCLFLPATGAEDPCGDERVAAGEESPWRYVFAAGGTSGGSVGIVSVVAQRIAPKDDEGSNWVHRLGGRDHVAPVLTHFVLGELPLSIGGAALSPDRAEVLIDGWASGQAGPHPHRERYARPP